MTNTKVVYVSFKKRRILNLIVFRHCEANVIQEPKTYFSKVI